MTLLLVCWEISSMPAFPCLGHYDDILTQFFPIYQIVFTNLSIPICHLPIWLYQIVITKMSLPNCHLPNCHLPIWLYQFVFTNLSLPNCLYQIVIYQIVNYQIIFTKNPPVPFLSSLMLFFVGTKL